jgi:predicted SprT family Zn-dependent metalloprotease
VRMSKKHYFFCGECENVYIQVSDLDKDYIIRWVPNSPIDYYPAYKCECGGHLFHVRRIKGMIKVLCA